MASSEEVLAEAGLTRRRDASRILRSIPKREVLRIKIISMGDSQSGKSCLIKRYCEERFVPRYISTIGVDFGVKKINIDGQEVRINFWDLSGMPDFFEVRNEFYKDAQGGILVYDVNNRKSFESLDGWMKESTKYGAKDIVLAVCANKTDAKKRAVTEREGQVWASQRGLLYFETSASTGDNVAEMFDAVFKSVLYNLQRY